MVATPSTSSQTKGVVRQVIGSVLDVEFPAVKLPKILNAPSRIMLLMIRIENSLSIFYDAKRLNHDPPLIYGSCFTYSLYSKTTGR